MNTFEPAEVMARATDPPVVELYAASTAVEPVLAAARDALGEAAASRAHVATVGATLTFLLRGPDIAVLPRLASALASCAATAGLELVSTTEEPDEDHSFDAERAACVHEVSKLAALHPAHGHVRYRIVTPPACGTDCRAATDGPDPDLARAIRAGLRAAPHDRAATALRAVEISLAGTAWKSRRPWLAKGLRAALVELRIDPDDDEKAPFRTGARKGSYRGVSFLNTSAPEYPLARAVVLDVVHARESVESALGRLREQGVNRKRATWLAWEVLDILGGRWADQEEPETRVVTVALAVLAEGPARWADQPWEQLVLLLSCAAAELAATPLDVKSPEEELVLIDASSSDPDLSRRGQEVFSATMLDAVADPAGAWEPREHAHLLRADLMARLVAAREVPTEQGFDAIAEAIGRVRCPPSEWDAASHLSWVQYEGGEEDEQEAAVKVRTACDRIAGVC